MFVEIADGEFIAVDTIASIRRYTVLRETGKTVAVEDKVTRVVAVHPETVKLPHWLIKTKRGETYQISCADRYYLNVVNLLNTSVVEEVADDRT